MAKKIVNLAKVNPCSPIFYLKIGETEVTYSKSKYGVDNVMSFSMKLTAMDVASDIQIIIYDSTMFLFEYEILRGYTQVQFKFGQDLTNMSNLYTATITDYELEFTGGGEQLTISLLLGGSTVSSEESTSYEGTPSEVVRQIAKEEGWKIGKIVDCDSSTSKTYNRTGQSAIDFIKQTLIPEAKSTEGVTNYTFYTTSDGDGNTVINFEPMEGSSVDKYMVYEMVIGQDHEAVISFRPSFKGLMYTLLGSTPQTSEELQSNSNSTDNNQAGVSVLSVDELTNTLVSSYTTSKSIVKRVGSSSYNGTQMGKIAEFLFTKSVTLSNSAELEIRGDASIVPQSFVVIIVLTKDGYFHHSSGLYQVLEVSHDLDMGNFTTTLNMFRRGMNVGEDGSITLLGPSESKFNPVVVNGVSTSSVASTGNLQGNFVSSQDIRTIFDDKYKGLPYRLGAKGPNAYDCSGFCSSMLQDLVKKNGGSFKYVGSTSQFMELTDVEVPWDVNQMQPGDCLVFIGNQSNGSVNRHVVMVVDSSTVCHAGSPLKYATIESQMTRFETEGKKKGAQGYKCVRPLAKKSLYNTVPSAWESKVK